MANYENSHLKNDSTTYIGRNAARMALTLQASAHESRRAGSSAGADRDRGAQGGGGAGGEGESRGEEQGRHDLSGGAIRTLKTEETQREKR